jgi:hypothetical protein
MIGRFQVMAVLQAARAKVLGLSLDSAKSWGLNRAIFYAAAKRGFIKPKYPLEVKIPEKIVEEEMRKEIAKTFKIYHLGDEMAYSIKFKNKLMFMIGNEVQTPEAFYKQIESRFGKYFPKAWKEALEICKSYDKGILKSQRYFYETVYKVRRDDLAKKWSEMVSKV